MALASGHDDLGSTRPGVLRVIAPAPRERDAGAPPAPTVAGTTRRRVPGARAPGALIGGAIVLAIALAAIFALPVRGRVGFIYAALYGPLLGYVFRQTREDAVPLETRAGELTLQVLSVVSAWMLGVSILGRAFARGAVDHALDTRPAVEGYGVDATQALLVLALAVAGLSRTRPGLWRDVVIVVAGAQGVIVLVPALLAASLFLAVVVGVLLLVAILFVLLAPRAGRG